MAPANRAQSHASLAAEIAKSDALFASIGDGVIATDERGNIVKINQVALDILGYKEHDVS